MVVAAKSEQSTDRLPGSIHETADAIRALGRRALAVPTDVRDEDAIRNMIEHTIAVARQLGLKTVAEGIETTHESHKLQGIGCNIGQGYLFAKPMPKAQLIGIMRARSRGAGVRRQDTAA